MSVYPFVFMRSTTLFFFFTLIYSPCFSQEEPDSLKALDEVIVRAFEQNRSLRSSVTPVSIIRFNKADRNHKTSLVAGFNTVAGVRMEERSPGSYRINIRGSSLRSPFGVRNVKVYWNDIPVTDPGGNTYFNQFAWNSFSTIEISKGPAGSLYGAGTGGLIVMHTLYPWHPGVQAEYITGSYDLHNIFTSFGYGKNENMNQLTFAHNQSNGYRTQSRMRRDNFSWVSKLKISERQQFTASVLFTDMYYETPGALTLAEFNNNPRNARPAAGTLPSAVNAKAAIDQLNFMAGFNHFYYITPAFTNHTTFYGALAEINNPAVRNYERRSEPAFGARTIFKYERIKESGAWQLVGGGEFQHGFFNTVLFKNKNGKPDTLQTNDDILYNVNSSFIQGNLEIKKWIINGGLSLNKTHVTLSRLSQFPVLTQTKSYRNELAPRISIRRVLTNELTLKGTVARGFSPPTVAELLPSTGVISTHLEAEYGWNYEMTVNYELFQRRLQVEATGFYFKLNKALVQRRDSSGADFFVNAGDVTQKGIEITTNYTGSGKGIIDYYTINTAYTYNKFRYGSFARGTNNFSGKTIPSVPANIVSALADINFKNALFSAITYYTASRIFLNDANTATAEAYHLLGWRLGWKKTIKQKFKTNSYRLNFYAGADNLLDENYSLGNDINAAANRFYNAAPRRNYYVGFSFQWVRVPGK